MKSHHRLCLLLLILAVQGFGCAVGPIWRQPVEIPSGHVTLKGKTIVVSDFKYAEQEVSYTRSSSISTILESAYVQDNSLIMAQKLEAAGIHAIAREGVKAKELKRDEILMRGAIIARPYKETIGQSMSGFVLVMSATILGMVIPSPVPFVYGEDFSYRVEFVDPSGNILFQSGDRYASAYYNSYYAWGTVMYAQEKKDQLISDMPGTLIDLLKKDVFR